MKKNRHTLFSLFMTVAAVLFLISAAVTILLWTAAPLYSVAARALKIPEKTGYSIEVCVRNVRAIVRYLCLWGPKVLELPDFTMSASGTLHFRDVRDILLVIQVMAILGLHDRYFSWAAARAESSRVWAF